MFFPKKQATNSLLRKLAFLWHLSVLLLAAWNLSHNNFVLPETRFSGAFLIISDHLFRFLLYAPLLLPLWYKLLLAGEAGKSLANKTVLSKKQSESFLRSCFAPVWKNQSSRNFTILLLVCFLLDFPASYVLLDGSLNFRDLWQLWVIYGLSVPSSFFFLVLSLSAGRSQTDANKGTSQSPPSQALFAKYRPLPEILNLQTAILLLAILYLLRLLFSGPALPRLEDEVAYYLQALILESGRLRAVLDLQGLPLSVQAAYKESLQIPYIFVKDGFFYSVHQHGYSMLLSALGPLKGYANYGLVFVSLFLFYVLLRIAGLSRKLRPWALLFFGSAPVLFFESDSYMAHPLALVLSLSITILYFSPAHFSFFSFSEPSAKEALAKTAFGMQKQDRVLYLRAGFLFFLGNALAFVRLQTALPLFVALIVYEIFFFCSSFFPSSKGQNVPSRNSSLAFADRPALKFILFFAVAASSFLLLRQYAKVFQSRSILFTGDYFLHIFGSPCQSIGFGQGHGCFPTLGTLGYSFRKFVLRIFEYAALLNQEFNAFGLPLGALLAIFLFRFVWRIFQDSPSKIETGDPQAESLHRKGLFAIFFNLLRVPPMLVFFCILSILHIGLFSLYFHNGGESFRGRYLLEIAPYLYLIFFLLLEREARQKDGLLLGFLPSRLSINKTYLLFSMLLLLFATQFLRTRGGYFHAEFLPVRHAADRRGEAIQNSLLTIEERLPFVASSPREKSNKKTEMNPKENPDKSHGFHKPAPPKTEYALFADEFGTGKKRLSKRQIRAAFQNGFGSLLASAKKIGPRGFFWDEKKNLLAGPLPAKQALALQRALGLRQAFLVRFEPPKPLLKKRRLKILQLARYHFHSLPPDKQMQENLQTEHEGKIQKINTSKK